jgi:hypothetical protein
VTLKRCLSCWSSLAVGLLALRALAGCEQGAEGDRCNPDLVGSDECNSGLTCVTPSSCVISVCCPSAPPYADPQCECFERPQGCACSVDAAYDAGVSSDASSRDGGLVDAAKEATHG